MNERIDVAIIGAGPSGLGTAMHLIRQDPSWAERMVVLEKGAHPRPKLCGGGLTPFAVGQLRQLGLTLDIPYVEVDSVRLIYGRREIVIKGDPVFVITRRPEFELMAGAPGECDGRAHPRARTGSAP